MLDSETKRRIDSARDILVGKVPDPKSQVEQITIALIYKFMDDMDRQSVEIGGKASFFKGEFNKYGWSNIFDPRLGGVEMLNLYGEAITRMSQNANLPELFRNIFKNAYLPYRDPETLKLFLKTINDFTYDHSEKLGDAFEYLLSVLGSQGDAGQFRTPRHIIDFMVQVLDPKKNETVLDPACGTAGFLISAYKHILKSNEEVRMKNDELRKGGKGSSLTAQEKQKIYENFTGYDISPDMVRLSLVNLYLHGFVKPQIHEYDSLASEERWNEYADVILANPPFMSPKGGIMPHKKFSVQSNRSEVLFVDYMAEHLTPNGRAAIIVPEGIIFQSAGAYKQLRKYLIEHNYLWAVVSLPAGVFNPYAGVKTSILFLDKALAKKTDQILFVKVEADGFDLGAQRRPIDRNDLPDALNTLHNWHTAVLDGKPTSFRPTIASALLVSTSRLAENDFNLSADRYREVARPKMGSVQMVKLGDLCTFMTGGTPSSTVSEYYENGDIPWLVSGDIHQQEIFDCEGRITKKGKENSNAKFLPKNSVMIALNGQGKTRGTVALLRMENATCSQSLVSINPIDVSKLLSEFLFHQLRSMYQEIRNLTGDNQRSGLNIPILKTIKIPLPPLEIQRQLVDEIAAHQRIIDGARQVVEGWKLDIELELEELLPEGVTEWEVVRLGDAKIEIIDGDRGINYPSKEDFSPEGYCLFLNTSNVRNGNFNFDNLQFIPQAKEDKLRKGRLQRNDIVLTTRGTVGNIALYDETIPYEIMRINSGMVLLRSDLNCIEPKYIVDLFQSSIIWNQLDLIMSGSAQPQLPIRNMVELKIPLPLLEIQREIVARIETERAIVHGNRELIRLYEEKVKKVIERVWEG